MAVFYYLVIKSFSSKMASSVLKFGVKVQTHSLGEAEFNGLVGEITGRAVVKNGVTRVPASQTRVSTQWDTL